MHKAIELLKKHEGYRRFPYYCSAGKLTIGYGYNLDAGMPEKEAALLLAFRVNSLHARAARTWPWYLYQPEPVQSVLINMAYNLGPSRLLGFRRMLAALKNNNYSLAAVELLDSKYATQVKGRADDLAAMLRNVCEEVNPREKN